MKSWIESLEELRAGGEPAMLVTVMQVRGSAPRECGARMLVTAEDLRGTIGGGQLEYLCSKIACDELLHKDGDAFLRRFPLGSNCGQCCGGVVEVLFENTAVAYNACWLGDLLRLYHERRPFVLATAMDASGRSGRYLITREECLEYGRLPTGLRDRIEYSARLLLAQPGNVKALRIDGHSVLLEPVMQSSMQIALFGAGHVGSAVVAAMAGLECEIRWIDSRRGIFPERVPPNVTCLESANPELEVAAMPPGAFYLVMSHSHPLDFEICSRILDRSDAAYCGLIGSRSKRRRFEKLMRRKGMPKASLDRLTCPIGVAGIESKKPAAIAIAVAAELLQKQEALAAAQGQPRANVHVLRPG